MAIHSHNVKVSNNNPVWSAEVTSEVTAMTGARVRLNTSGTYIIISNTTAVNVTLHAGDTAPGIVIEPNGSFEIAVDPTSDIRANAAAGNLTTFNFP